MRPGNRCIHERRLDCGPVCPAAVPGVQREWPVLLLERMPCETQHGPTTRLGELELGAHGLNHLHAVREVYVTLRAVNAWREHALRRRPGGGGPGANILRHFPDAVRA